MQYVAEDGKILSGNTEKNGGINMTFEDSGTTAYSQENKDSGAIIEFGRYPSAILVTSLVSII